jgi:hypothetical protein
MFDCKRVFGTKFVIGMEYVFPVHVLVVTTRLWIKSADDWRRYRRVAFALVAEIFCSQHEASPREQL